MTDDHVNHGAIKLIEIMVLLIVFAVLWIMPLRVPVGSVPPLSEPFIKRTGTLQHV